jgi:hypothetical protein
MRYASTVLLVLTAIAAGCGGSSSDTPDAGWTAGGPTATYEMTSGVILPPQDVALNLDGDSQGRLDDAFGSLLGSFDPDVSTSASVTIDLRVTPATDGAHALLEAGGTSCWGQLTGQHLIAAGCAIPVALQVGDRPPLELNLVGAMVDLDTSSCTGRLGGGLTTNNEVDDVLPWLAGLFDERVGETCDATGCVPNDACRSDLAACDGEAMSLRDLFDECTPKSCTGDGHISVAELRQNWIMTAALAPDVELLGPTGAYHPVPITSSDATPDLLSFGMSFTCTKR